MTILRLFSEIKTNITISWKNALFEIDIFFLVKMPYESKSKQMLPFHGKIKVLKLTFLFVKMFYVLNQNNHCHFTEKIKFFNLTILFVKMLYVLKSKLTLQFHEKKNTFNSFLNFSCELKSARNAGNPSSEPVTP